ncbi:hypothetical protein LTR91_006624 [Friedmanniomyces endolithicus]|uniref:Uncharacterized protein n=1 Tax=Friedmanniomyces endolithicus TaxID=329885 RepID=A0AAN6FNG1_9PEZI|nr:hypothetical protein LTR35_006569 [Friedmanniomyces endolithicus]KAK0297169.1 hypothetical protein LTS00_004448 [Friedmanniomyces endolithicus]KAK0320625.1 hypothetical protein LTR82_008338 [Friedmanniomyces endolithicus]KAK0928029.1 hypothetical protein LTR57_002763 [Friedmanniomyces endolithicus]KAK0966498.1 hypothetical protein LTS01_017773 [Friedmanniomyces endolithicus]
MTEQTRSHGRGGAGNIAAKASTTAEAKDFSTPTIKSNTYTTGRGGQGRRPIPFTGIRRGSTDNRSSSTAGNMATNLENFPEFARAAQDVNAPAHHEKETRGTYHWGRGGEGNMMTVGSDKSKERPGMDGEGQQRRGSFQGIMEKGKEMLGLGKGKPPGGSAVVGGKEGSPVVEGK